MGVLIISPSHFGVEIKASDMWKLPNTGSIRGHLRTYSARGLAKFGALPEACIMP